MRKAMMDKIVCDYCGTIYDAEKAQCPLCGNKSREAEARKSAQSERKAASVKKELKKKERTSREIPRKLLIASIVFLSLAVLVVVYFVGDMLGFWPGLEDVLNATMRVEELERPDESSCTYLDILPEEITFTEVGQIQKLRVIMNEGCTETLTFITSNAEVAMVSEEAKYTSEEDMSAITAEVTAVGAGQANITVSCGSKSVVCPVTCNFSTEPSSEATEPSQPVLKLSQEDITLQLPRETAVISIENLPEDAVVVWSSSDETVATVDEDGKIVGIGSGTATITAQVGEETLEMTVRCDFENTAESNNHLTHTDVTISVGESFNLRLIDANGERIDDATYSSNNTSVCSVSGVRVTGESSGMTKVIVSYGGQSYTCIVRVK